ncbi:MAG: hypothetical protein D6674_07105 [Acidobacteria bacterium]|jgi:hypothetical protein|nr:MAG: hypothetical protein D6674_07105 [Acidobacteriota bacterium]
MRFYIITFLLSYIQSSLFLALFHNFLLTPDLTLVYLLLNLAHEERLNLKKPIYAGLLLDILQDSLGLQLSGKLFFALALSIVRLRVEFTGRLSLIVAYIPLSLLQKLLMFILFRIKYYTDVNILLLIGSLMIEVLFLTLMAKWLIKEGNE